VTRFIDMTQERGGVGPRRCEAEGCGKPTREGKPWCSEHVLTHSPYAIAVSSMVVEEPAGFSYEFACVDCKSPFRAKSKKAKKCPQCRKASQYQAAADYRARQREAS
jgi:hypothetical protein